jgi:hypothetical protein
VAAHSDVHQAIGPLGSDLRVRNQSLPGVCGSSAGRIVTVCVGLNGPTLFLRGRGRVRAAVRLRDGRTVRL